MSLCPALLAALVAIIACGPAAAQSCTTDFHCSPSAASINVCLGDTLILKQRRCMAGSCQETEVGRVSCGSGGAIGTCEGNTFVRSGGRCDALAGRCAQGGSVRIACIKTCSCAGKTLSISTGICTPGAGCGRAVFRCKQGCQCQPEPRCTEDAEPAASGVEPPRPTSSAPRPPSRLPPREAEPFEPEPPPAATPPGSEGNVRRKRR